MHHARLGGTVLFFVLALSNVAPAQPAPPPPARPIAPGVVPNRAPPPPAPTPPSKGGSTPGKLGGLQLPPAPTPSPTNLAVVALTSNSQCEVRVTVKNQGAELQGTEDITYWVRRESPATGDLPAKIPLAQLRAPGSVVTVTFPGLHTAYDQATNFTASVQSNVRDHRAGAAGTSVTNSLKCGYTPAKLELAVGFEQDCKKVLMVRNVGGDLGSSPTNPTFVIDRISDGWQHKPLIPGSLNNNGLASGATMRLTDNVRTFESFKYTVRQPSTGSLGNTVEQTVPDRCRGPKPAYAIDLADVRTNLSTCKVEATLENTGAAPIPPTVEIPVQFRRDNAPSEEVKVWSAMGIPAGGTITAVSRMTLGIPKANVGVTIKLPTGDLGPKIFPLNCQK